MGWDPIPCYGHIPPHSCLERLWSCSVPTHSPKRQDEHTGQCHIDGMGTGTQGRLRGGLPSTWLSPCPCCTCAGGLGTSTAAIHTPAENTHVCPPYSPCLQTGVPALQCSAQHELRNSFPALSSPHPAPMAPSPPCQGALAVKKVTVLFSHPGSAPGAG